MALSARRVSIISQKDSLAELARIASADVRTEIVYKTARQIIQAADCRDRDGLCELRAIFTAVKEGDPRVPTLKTRLRYMSDPQTVDAFVRPARMLQWCLDGACAEDCDSHAALVAALCVAVGFRAGLRAYGPDKNGAFTHVYAVAMLPKFSSADDVTGRPSTQRDEVIGLDTTVSHSSVGWQPPPGRVMTAWILPQGIQIEGFRR